MSDFDDLRENAQPEEEETQPEETPEEGQEVQAEEEAAQTEEPQEAAAEEPELTPESVQAEIRRTRHKKEVPLYIACIVLGIIGSISVMMRSFQGDGLIDQMKEFIMKNGAFGDPGAAQAAIVIVLTILGFIMGVGSLIGMMILVIVSLYQIYGQQMAYSVRVSETNFPEIYAKVQEYSRLLGIKEPEVYVQQQNGTLNAFTAWVPGKTFIQLNAEIVDIAYMEHKDLDTVLFVMAHEFGHIYLHHVQLKYMFWNVLVNFVPVLGPVVMSPLLSRSREYSADRVGQALTAGKNELDCMMLLGTGRHVYKYMDADKYVEEITKGHNSVERLVRWITNLTASHPIMPYRTQAILDPEKKSGRLL